MKKTTTLCAVVCLLTACLQAQPQSAVTISPRITTQGADLLHPDAPSGPPVRIISQVAPSGVIVSAITLVNHSSKTAVEVEYGWRIAEAAACSGSSLEPRWETASAAVKLFPDGDEVSIKVAPPLSQPGSATKLADQARAANTDVVVVTIGILKVRFADGSTWMDSEAAQNKMFDNGEQEKAATCNLPTIGKLHIDDRLSRSLLKSNS
jgi:hypothetical protein